MARCLQHGVAEVSLHLNALVHVVVNVQAGLQLLLEGNVVNGHGLGLADAHDPCRRLVHCGRRPPGRGEDDAVHELEVQPRAATLELGEQDGLLGLSTLMRLHLRLQFLQHLLPCRAACVAPVAEHLAHAGHVLEALLEDLHLITEVAEDHVPMRLGLGLQNLDHLGDLRGIYPPCGAAVGRVGPLACADVDLGVHADLTEAQDEREEHRHVLALLFHEMLELLHEASLNAAVEDRLCFCDEGEAVDLNRGVPREHVAQCLLELLLGAPERAAGHPRLWVALVLLGHTVGHVEERHETVKVVNDVHHGSAREEPAEAHGHLPQGLGFHGILVAQNMGLIADHAVKCEGLEELPTGHHLVVVGDVDLRARLHGPPLPTGALSRVAQGPHAKSRIPRRLAPLLDEGQGAQNEGLGHLLVAQKAEHGEGLSETHLVAQETSRIHGIQFPLHHPLHRHPLVVVQGLASDCCLNWHCKRTYIRFRGYLIYVKKGTSNFFYVRIIE